MICGGCINLGDFPPNACGHSDICWRYIPDVDDWEIIGNLNEAAAAPAHDYSEAFGFAIAHHEGPSFEVTQDGVNFELLAPYPNTDVMGVSGGTGDDGCLVVLDEKNVFLAGGRIDSDDPFVTEDFSPRAFLYNRDNDQWSEVESMPQGRKLHSCGVVDSFAGYQVIVAGTKEYPPDCLTCVEGPEEISVNVYDIRTNTWINGEILGTKYYNKISKISSFIGTDLPYGVAGGATVRTEQSFAIVGGFSMEMDQDLDTILMYQPQDNTWMELPGRLKTPRSGAMAIAIDPSIFPECPGYESSDATMQVSSGSALLLIVFVISIIPNFNKFI